MEVSVAPDAAGLFPFLENLVAIDPAKGRRRPAPTLALRFDGQYRQRPAEAKIVYEALHAGVSGTARGFYLTCGASCLDIDVAAGEACGFLAKEFWAEPLENRREFFLLGLVMLLRRSNTFGLHANGVASDGRGFLLAGDSGSGKTTLTLACLRAGWSYLSDDALLLRPAAGAVEALAYRRGFSCGADTVARFPELAPFAAEAPVVAGRKRLLDLDSVYSGRSARSCVPRAIFFPRVGGDRRSRLYPLGTTEALTRLIRQSPGILTQPEFARPQLETLRQLAEQAPAFEFVSGGDVFDEPGAVPALMEAAGKGA
ncbi:MAG: hypothetical protein KIT09_21265 [Bryobacteraceae bacterium]|nr:hypothetical protein [Bryobacteraceae bacterium]